jgi:cell division protein FtsL
MAKRRRLAAPSARSVVALLLLGFVLVTTGVIARRVKGVGQARTIQQLRLKRDELRAERIRLDSAIRDASSRARIVPIAEQRLNMHIAPPEQQVFLPRPRPIARPKNDSL